MRLLTVCLHCRQANSVALACAWLAAPAVLCSRPFVFPLPRLLSDLPMSAILPASSESVLAVATTRQRLSVWLLHLITACGGVFGLFALYFIYLQDYTMAFWLMAGALVIDSFDGLLARRLRTNEVNRWLDGALLDNLVDFTTYVVVPAFFMLVSPLLPPAWRMPVAAVVVLASLFQFAQVDAKTEDHFFKGFPSYWNILVFYLLIWGFDPTTNAVITLILAVLVFVPIKYAYLSRPDHLFATRAPKVLMLLLTGAWGLATLALLILYPQTPPMLVLLTAGYLLLYLGVSVLRTVSPLPAAAFARVKRR